MQPSLRIDTNVGLVYVGKFVPKTTVEPDCGSPPRTMRLSVNIVEHNPIVTTLLRAVGDRLDGNILLPAALAVAVLRPPLWNIELIQR
jgi:hypothetical protein